MAGEQRGVEKHQFIPEDYFSEVEKEVLFPGYEEAELDVGCGDGSFLLQMAAQYPGRAFLGLERLLGRVRKVCRQAERQDLKNVQVLRLESGYALEYLLPRQCFSRVHLLFPDPWPKKKHRARRLVQPDFLRSLARVMRPDGEFLFKTDDLPYFEEATEVLDGSELFVRESWEDDDFFYPRTDFEAHWLKEGKKINRARYRRA